jgi:hypothetical protein
MEAKRSQSCSRSLGNKAQREVTVLLGPPEVIDDARDSGQVDRIAEIL